MTPRLRPTDVVRLLATVAVGALAVSLGLGAHLAGEVTVALTVLQLVAVLLRAPHPPTVPQPPVPPQDATGRARRTVELAQLGPWGVRGDLRRRLRAAVEATGAEPDRLPPLLAAVVEDSWPEDRGLTPEELDAVLTATEELGR